MGARQSRLIEDLAGIFRGEIHCDPLSQALYASDGSLHQITPFGVACPRDRDDVLTLMRYAAEEGLAVVPRGAGTSVGGEALGTGIVVDFSRHMHRIEEIGSQTVRVQPGVVHSRLNRVLKESGRYFPPDPSNTATTTIGSMLALDSAGSHSIRVGSTRDHVVSLEVVMANGRVFEAANESLESLATGAADAPIEETIALKRMLASRLATLLSVNAALIDEKQPARQFRNRAGYMLRGVLANSTVSFPRLLIGSEGTLGLFTGATLRTAALPAHRCALLIIFESIESAVQAVQTIARLRPSACDLLDRRLLTLARDLDPRFASLIPVAAEAALIVEQTGFSQSEITLQVHDLMLRMKDLPDAGRSLFEATTYDEIEFLWSLPYRVVPLLNRARGETSPLPIVEDIAVPPEALPEFVGKARRVLQRHEVTASMYAHAAAGQLHIRPFLPMPLDARRMEDLARDLYFAALSVGGSISGEHGLGLSRTAFLRSQYGELYRVFQQVKTIFDPHNLLNPGKVLTDDPHLTINHLRPQSLDPSPLVELQLSWTSAEFDAAAAACHGCGSCRTQEPNERMCPFFHLEPSEQRSPRAKANAIRAIMDGRLPAHDLASSAMQTLSRLCFNCKQCELECPSNVDIPHLMLEAKAQHVAANGPRTSEWFVSRVHAWGDFLCRFSWLVNPLLNVDSVRWILERLFGLARRRKLPPFARRTFLNSAPRDWLAPPVSLKDPAPVIYFVDHFANCHDPELGFALGRIVEHHGRPFHVPPGQTRSGMALISIGDLEAARPLAEKNIRVLAEFAREGCPIVCTEPATVICLKREYPLLLDHPDVQLVADHVVDAGDFLARWHQSRELRTDFSPLTFHATYHTPCHRRVLGAETALINLCRLIPQFRASSVEHGCSGMAGTYGLTSEHFDESIKIGAKLIEQMRSSEIDFGLTECSSCKLQMEQQSPTPTLHPLKVLALAYGLMPDVRRRFKPNLKKRLTS
ncbi:FAD-binding and (Fe-S)-binding domain-containing protein [Schlesneria paludicola]|uniref:FAD-binding and (Fe-S)-binding domain-containing protein n=1 Tax=Schlesneria paludicola TaxID=360056 RepID=UPI00029A7A29|nr:FAD-binding and (Fe-S)-binding domain-containing protein [Schlesneria paludicola]